MKFVRALIAVLFLIAISTPLAPAPVSAQATSGCVGIGWSVKPLSYQQQTVSSEAVALTSVPGNADIALILVSVAPIRYRADGTNPTALLGMTSATGSALLVCGWRNISAMRMIATGSDSTLDIHYYGR